MNSDELLVSLRRIMRAVYLHSKQLEKQAGLTVPQVLIMRAVAHADGLPVSRIARAVSLSQGTVTSVLDRLENRGYVQRRRDPVDRRLVAVSLTAEGRARLAGAPGLLQEGFVRRYGQLPDWEQSLLIAAVQRIASLMDAQSVEAAPILQVGEIEDPGPTTTD